MTVRRRTPAGAPPPGGRTARSRDAAEQDRDGGEAGERQLLAAAAGLGTGLGLARGLGAAVVLLAQGAASAAAGPAAGLLLAQDVVVAATWGLSVLPLGGVVVLAREAA